MVWPVESQEYGSYQYLLRETAAALGLPRDAAQWDYEQASLVDSVVQRAVLGFYTPPPLGENDPGHEWSFLRPTRSLATATSTYIYDLPEDFAQLDGEPTFSAGSSLVKPIVVVAEHEIRQRHAEATTGGQPELLAVRVKEQDGSQGTRYEALFWPTPDAVYTVDYRMRLNPLPLSETNRFPYGGQPYYSAIHQACLAEAEAEKEAEGPQAAKYQRRLAAAIGLDRRFAAQGASGPAVGPVESYEFGSYLYLMRETGALLGLIRNPNAWDYQQTTLVDALVQRAVLRFYSPPPLPADSENEDAPGPHEWSFLHPTRSLATAASTYIYDLPDDCAEVDGAFTFAAGSEVKKPVPVTSEEELRRKREEESASGRPQLAAIRVKEMDGAEGTRYEVLFWPTPDAAYTLDYRMRLHALPLSETNKFPYGGQAHYGTVLEACLAEAELEKGAEGPHAARFAQVLATSVAHDRPLSERLRISEDQGPFETYDYGSYQYLMRETGAMLGLVKDLRLWDTTQTRHIDSLVQRAVLGFYAPAPRERERYGHDWRFLRPTRSLVTVASTYIYDLPEDFSQLDGPLTFAPGSQVLYKPITITSDHEIRRRQEEGTSTSRPELAAIRVKEMDGAEGTRYEVLFWPTPDAAYTLDYRMRLNPLPLSETNKFPYGGQPHYATVLAACRTEAEMDLGEPGPYTVEYEERLAASISHDRKAASPAYLGPDWGAKETGDVGNWHEFDQNIVTYTGYTA